MCLISFLFVFLISLDKIVITPKSDTDDSDDASAEKFVDAVVVAAWMSMRIVLVVVFVFNEEQNCKWDSVVFGLR